MTRHRSVVSGGTMGIATPYPYSYTAKSLIAELGVQVEKNSEFFNRALFEQNRIGQQELLSTTYEQYEREIRSQLGRMLSGGGFDPATDIAAITVNRWPYGYAYTYDSLSDPDVPPEQRPHVVGRQRFGSVAIANADAGAAAFTNQAIDEGHRAVQELLVSHGLT